MKNYLLPVFLVLQFIVGCDRSDILQNPKVGEGQIDPPPRTAAFLKAAQLEFSGMNNGVIDFGTQSVTSINEQVITIKNTGEQTAKALSFTSLQPPFYLKASNCGTEIAGGVTCEITIRYVPSTTAASNLALEFSYHDGEEEKRKPVSMLGTGSYVASLRLSLNPNTYEPLTGPVQFGPVAPGAAPKVIPLTLYFFGSRPASGLQFSGLSNQFSVSNNCPTEVSNKCTVTVSYQGPAGTSTSQNLLIKYFNSDYADSTSQSVVGTTDPAVIPATLTLAATQAFGTVLTNSSKSATLNLAYAGNVPALANGSTFVTLTNLGGDNAFSLANKICGPTVDATHPCRFDVVFNPTVSGKNYSATAVVSYQDGAGNSKTTGTLSISGKGGERGTLRIVAVDGTGAFGGESVNCFKELNFALYNDGANATAAQNITYAFAAGSNASFSKQNGTTANCGSSLAAGVAPCYFKIRFTPNASTAGLAATLNINYADDGTVVQNANLQQAVTGNGETTPKLSLSVTSLAFGSAFTGGAAVMRPFQVRFCGTTPVTFSSVQITGTDSALYSFPAGFPGTGSTNPACNSSSISTSCNANLAFNPVSTANGTKNATVTLNYLNGTTPIALTLPVSGSATHTPAVVSVLESGTMGRTPKESPLQKTFTFKNTSAVEAKNFVVSALPSAAGFSISQNNCVDPGGGLFSLMASQSCTVIVQFVNATPGDYMVTLSATYLDPLASKTASVDVRATSIIPIKVSANGHHTCMITDKSQVKCWGLNGEGQLGLGNTNSLTAPGAAVVLGSGIPAQISTGFFHTCVLFQDGNIKCWGRNSEGQLGNGTFQTVGNGTISVASAAVVNLGGKATAVSAAYHFTCALLDTGVVKCWGYNGQGQLGAGDATTRNIPVTVNLDGIKATEVLAHGGGACAKLQNGALKCWGDNFFGQLGTGIDLEAIGNQADQMGSRLPAVIFPTGLAVANFSVGNGFSCAHLTDGSLRCWGKNDATGNLGHLYCQNDDIQTVGLCSNASYPDQIDWIGRKEAQMAAMTPINLGSGLTIERVQSGHFFSCVQFSNKTVKCFGNNATGTLGLGDLTSRGALASQMGSNLPALDFGTGVTVKRIEVGDTHSCVILTDTVGEEKLKCWGENQYGQLGIANTTSKGGQSGQMGNALPFIIY